MVLLRKGKGNSSIRAIVVIVAGELKEKKEEYLDNKAWGSDESW